jgi:hypothetical protein
MMRTVLVITVVAALLFVAVSWVRRELAIDRCHDQGGRWNAARSACEGTHTVWNLTPLV